MPSLVYIPFFPLLSLTIANQPPCTSIFKIICKDTTFSTSNKYSFNFLFHICLFLRGVNSVENWIMVVWIRKDIKCNSHCFQLFIWLENKEFLNK